MVYVSNLPSATICEQEPSTPTSPDGCKKSLLEASRFTQNSHRPYVPIKPPFQERSNRLVHSTSSAFTEDSKILITGVVNDAILMLGEPAIVSTVTDLLLLSSLGY